LIHFYKRITMTDLPTVILQHLDSANELDSLKLALKLQVDEQKLVGAIKSLECLGDVIKTKIYQVKSWKLSGEGEEVSTSGSHEARVYNLVPGDGIPQSALMSSCGPWG